MNKKLLAIAVGAAISVPTVALAEGPTVYGKINLDVEMQSYDPEPAAPNNDSVWKLDSNASRLGVKGDFDLDVGGLQAVYKAEFQIHVDDGDSGGQVFSQRNIYGGLKGGFGQVIAGKFDTPLKTSQGKVDQFNDLDGDISSFMTGDERANNIVQYSSPTLADAFTVTVATIFNEDNDDFDDNGENENGLTDTISASVVFESGPLYVALAQDIDNAYESLDADETGAAETIDITRLTGMFKADAFEVGAIYQIATENANTGDDGEDTSMLLSGAFKVGKGKIKAQYGMTDGDLSENELTTTSIGYDHKLSKASKVFVYYTMDEDKDGATGDTDETDTFAVGLEHKF